MAVFFQKKYSFIIAYLFSILCIFLGYFMILFSSGWDVFPQLSNLSRIAIPILTPLVLIFFFIKPRFSYFISFLLSLIIIFELANVVVIILGLKELVYGDIMMTPGFFSINLRFYLLIFGGIILTYVAINGIRNKYDSDKIKPLKKWFLGVLILAGITYLISISGIFGGGHPKYNFSKARLYDCYSHEMNCSIDLGDNYDLAKKQSPFFKEKLSTCIDCWVNGKLILPENDFPWLQVVMYLYSNDPKYRDGLYLNDKIIFKVDKGVTEVNFSLGDEKINPGNEIRLLTWVYYGFYEVMRGEYKPVTRDGYGVPENVIVTGNFVDPDLEIIYSEDEIEELYQQKSLELKKKISTDMTKGEIDYLKKYVKLENFEQEYVCYETGQCSINTSGSINNLGNKTINLLVLSGGNGDIVIVNNRKINKYGSLKNVQPDTILNFVDISQPDITTIGDKGYIKKIYFDW